ncbi:MAG: hypothetical protein RSD81_06070 [Pseudomonas sp.]
MGIVQWRPFMHFTAQSTALQAFHLMIGRLKNGQLTEGEYPCVVVFMAFSIEAYLNTLGSRQISFWDEIERLPWRKKVEILHSAAGAKTNWGEGSLQFAADIFRIRDNLAHGKPEKVCGPWRPGMPDDTHRESFPHLKPKHLASITSEWLLDSAEKLRTLMAYLGELFDHHESDHLRVAVGGYDLDDGVD